jgi:hypothetical protein
MLDNNGKGISSAAIENLDFSWFRDFGSAYAFDCEEAQIQKADMLKKPLSLRDLP